MKWIIAGAALCASSAAQAEVVSANANLGVSLASARAATEDVGLPLYRYLAG